MLYTRVDMNQTITTSHVMRCLSIADTLRWEGEETIFVLADEQAAEVLDNRRCEYIVLHTEWNQMEAELPTLLKEIEQRKILRILIDSYQVTEHYLVKLRECVETIYMDELNVFQYPVNAIICYANYWNKFHYEEQYTSVKLRLGTQYVSLQEAFWNCGAKIISPQVKNLLILSGGSTD